MAAQLANILIVVFASMFPVRDQTVKVRDVTGRAFEIGRSGFLARPSSAVGRIIFAAMLVQPQQERVLVFGAANFTLVFGIADVVGLQRVHMQVAAGDVDSVALVTVVASLFVNHLFVHVQAAREYYFSI
jgi:hypothetical protein